MRDACRVLAAILTLVSAARGDTIDGRFVAKSGSFSIDMHRMRDGAFHLSRESASSDVVIADFMYSPGATFHGLFAGRTIEWFNLSQPIAKEQCDQAAGDAVTGYLDGRLGRGKFQVTAKRKARTDDGQLYYVFSARGVLNDSPMDWRGVIVIFDSGIALVSQIAPVEVKKWGVEDAFDEAQFVSWAITVRPGK
jgi:hypothetical protein